MNEKTLAAVLAHPDDESFPIGGTLARYAHEGVDVHLIVATLGEAGIAGKSAAEAAAIRRAELQRACSKLGVRQIHHLGLHDGRLAHTRDAEGHARLETVLRRVAPDVVITFGPDGISGHPDHVTVSQWTTSVFDQLSKETNGPRRLYYIAPSEATQQGCGIAPPAEAVGGPVAFIDVGDHLEEKVRAAQQHASQNPPFSGAPEEEAKELACHELFRLARPWKAANGAGPEVDLFTAITQSSRKKQASTTRRHRNDN